MAATGFKITDLRINPENPFPFTGTNEEWESFKRKLDRNPEFLEANKIAYDSSQDNLVIAGNKRVQGLMELGWKMIPKKYVIDVAKWSPEKVREYIYASNYNIGQWSMEFTDEDMAEEYGIEFDYESMETDDAFDLPDGHKSSLQQITYTLANEQAKTIKDAVVKAKETEAYKYMETFGNENGNGNAIYLIVTEWLQANK